MTVCGDDVISPSTQLYIDNPATSKTTLAIDPCTGECQWQVSFKAKNKKRPTKWVRPQSQRGKFVKIIGWKEKNIFFYIH